MFFKKIFILCFLLFSPSISSAKFLSSFTCFKDIREYYPHLLNGSLAWTGQKRFFRCVHDALQLFVEKEIFTHDPSRDYFTREEIFRMFRLYFEYDQETSALLTNRVFFVKKLLVGGSIDQLKDKEISDLYSLIYDYQEAYFILHKVIPTFHKAFSGGLAVVSPEEKDKALNQVRKSLFILNKSYQRENIIYPIEDIYKYGKYLLEAQLTDESAFPFFEKGFLFLQNSLEGTLSPQKVISGPSWEAAFQTLFKGIELFLYYKTYFTKDLPSGIYAYRVIESLEIFLSLLEVGESKGYPLNHLDQMLSVLISFLNVDSSSLTGKVFVNLQKPHSIPLLTRIIFCFSLADSNSQKECQSDWKKEGSSILTISFKDLEFEVFPDKIESKPLSPKPFLIEPEKRNRLKNWLFHYKQSLVEIYSGQVEEVARENLFEHWLNPFFGWEAKSSRIRLGSFEIENQTEKAAQILHYRFFLSLLFSSYLPEDFFHLEKTEEVSIPFARWKSMVEDMTPVFFVLNREEGYESSWRSSLLKLFSFADKFLYSSNQDDQLKAEEFIDMSIHLLEGIKTERIADEKVFKVCGPEPQAACSAEVFLSDPEVLSAYPRFQKYLFNTEIHTYREKIKSILEGQRGSSTSLLPLFLLIQVLELNYAIIDKNQSFKLESEELLPFVKKFEEQIALSIPQIANSAQARAFLMYAFQTGFIPFFTGDSKTPLEFTHWHLHPKSHKAFKVSPNQFHYLLLDFYQIYQKYEGF